MEQRQIRRERTTRPTTQSTDQTIGQTAGAGGSGEVRRDIIDRLESMERAADEITGKRIISSNREESRRFLDSIVQEPGQ